MSEDNNNGKNGGNGATKMLLIGSCITGVVSFAGYVVSEFKDVRQVFAARNERITTLEIRADEMRRRIEQLEARK